MRQLPLNDENQAVYFNDAVVTRKWLEHHQFQHRRLRKSSVRHRIRRMPEGAGARQLQAAQDFLQ